MGNSLSSLHPSPNGWWRNRLRFAVVIFATVIVIVISWNWHDLTLRAVLARADSMIVSVRRYRESIPQGEPRFRSYKLTPEQSKAFSQFLRERTFGASDRLYARLPLFVIKTLDDKGEECGRMMVYVTERADREVLRAMEAIAENGEPVTHEGTARTHSTRIYRYVNR